MDDTQVAPIHPKIVVIGVLFNAGPEPARRRTDGAARLWVYFMMVARGLLFLELHGSTRRARAFRHRAGS